MTKRILMGAAGLGLLVATLLLASRPLGLVPPVGPLLDAGQGIWAVPGAAKVRVSEAIRLPIFEGSVTAIVDTRGVPHIYADQELDAYRALGYLVARDRLFQLELQTRAAAGTLTELLGSRALAVDREARRLGFGRMVERELAATDTLSDAFRSVEAYGQGVNAWIAGMSGRDLPLEYRLLGARPSQWNVANTYLLLARMALTLAYNDASIQKASAAAKVGWPAADALFPVEAPIQEPIQPNPVDSTRFAFRPIPPPLRPDSAARHVTTTGSAAQLALGRFLRWSGEEAVGSNNWVVGPARSATGHALLAGDPHLELTLPSIWYQAHLVVPDRLDVTGVTLPGAPWVIIGFNRSIAWSFTNTGSDVNDFYREVVDDQANPTQYRLDGNWRPLDRRIEAYRSPAGAVLAVDTVRFTHRGPLWKADSTWLSMAWTAYEAKNNGAEFLAIDRARNASEFLERSASYAVPAQNMVVADRGGTIAIRSTGRYPIRPGSGRGDSILDGTLSANDWGGDLPLEFYPFSLNPRRGFLSSANQQPVDPMVNSRFLGANWYSPWRAIRINTSLRADSQVTVEAMRRWQTDPGSARADRFLPYLRTGDSLRGPAAPAQVNQARALLASWNGRYELDSRGPVLFEAVMNELGRRTWDELGPPGSGQGPRPAEAILLGLLADSASVWWDDRATPALIERRGDIIEASLSAGLDSVLARHGPPEGEGWLWRNAHHANIHHLLRLPALSALDLEVPSGPNTISPSGAAGTHGSSWRMVVELGSEVVGWATYPGGQSGNPVSAHYRDFLPRWLAGELDSLVVPPRPDLFPALRIESRITFGKGP